MSTHEIHDDVLAQVQRLSVEELQGLIDELNLVLKQRVEKQPKPRYSILDFEGIARGTWDDEGGVDEYLRKGRES
jgi:hypothetical protein